VDWYDSLLAAFERNQEWIVENFGEDWRRYVVHWYGSLRNALARRALRGVVFRATTA
jgi:hypothetical protein